MFMRTFYNDISEVHGIFSSNVITKILPRNSTAPNLLTLFGAGRRMRSGFNHGVCF